MIVERRLAGKSVAVEIACILDIRRHRDDCRGDRAPLDSVATDRLVRITIVQSTEISGFVQPMVERDIDR